MTNPYPWLHVGEDGSIRADLKNCTGAEMDRRLVIMQEIEAGRVVPTSEVERLREVLRRIADGDVPGTGDYSECVERYAQQQIAPISPAVVPSANTQEDT